MRGRFAHASLRTTCGTKVRRGFTLTELLVAIGVLVIVIVATARIFGTVSKVTGAGQANADLLQTAQSVERQLRDDISRISREGFLVIESIDVSNSVNGPTAPLLNPALSPSATLRSDRLAFFIEGSLTSSQFAGSQQLSGTFDSGSGETKYTLPVNQASVARVYFGHGVQVPVVSRDPSLAGADAFPVLGTGLPLLPWTFDFASDGPDLTMQKWDTGANVKDVSATQPLATKWILARQLVLLADDGANGFGFYNQTNTLNSKKNSTRYLWLDAPTGTGNTYDPGAASSRVDISAHTLDKLRADCTNNGKNTLGNTRAQMLRVLNDPNDPSTAVPMRFPRVESVAPSMNRADQMLTNTALAVGCSSFEVDWTWADRTGRVDDPNTLRPFDPTPASVSSGDEFVGLYLAKNGEQPWFGFPNTARGVQPLSNALPYTGAAPSRWGSVGLPIYRKNIEGTAIATYPGLPGVQVYRAVFGYNQDRPVEINETTGNVVASPALGYTPWPSALRITMTLHDPRQRFAEGRTFQFVVELPQR